jgi:hypothetical protein
MRASITRHISSVNSTIQEWDLDTRSITGYNALHLVEAQTKAISPCEQIAEVQL